MTAPIRAPLCVRVRAQPLTEDGDLRERRYGRPRAPPRSWMRLTVDTETTTDTRKSLRFGTAVLEGGGSTGRIVFFSENLGAEDLAVLTETAAAEGWDLLPRAEFLRDVLFPVLRAGGVVQGLNLPFDLGALADDFSPKVRLRGKNAFNLYYLGTGKQKGYTIRVETLSSSKHLFSFSGPGIRRDCRGALLDVPQLHRAIYGPGPASLKHLAEVYGTAHQKLSPDTGHGRALTPAYVKYAMADAVVTAEVADAARQRWERFGLALPAERVYSGASIAKAAWDARGVAPPPMEPGEESRVLRSYYGGRAEALRTGVTEDVAILDVTSMYPSLWCLLGLSRALEAQRLDVDGSPATVERVRRFVSDTPIEALFRPETWARPEMLATVDVLPDGDVLPARIRVGEDRAARVTISRVRSKEPQVYMVADVLASRLLGGTVPEIVGAHLYVPNGRQPVRDADVLGVRVPATEDLIKHLTEVRAREKLKPRAERDPMLSDGVKPIINSGSYGIFVEETIRAAPNGTLVWDGAGGAYVDLSGIAAEEGRFFSPLLASAITSGARLLLALIETAVRDGGGEMVYCDTDSAFVTPSSIADAVAARFNVLNPYAVKVPLLKNETEEKAPPEEYPRGSRQSHPSLYAVSSKRYCLFALDGEGMPHPFPSGERESGLGAYSTPAGYTDRADLVTDRADLVTDLWGSILAREVAGRAPTWKPYQGRPLHYQMTVTKPGILAGLDGEVDTRPFAFHSVLITTRGPLHIDLHSPEEIAEMVEDTPEVVGIIKTWDSLEQHYPLHSDGKFGPHGTRHEVIVDGLAHIDKETHTHGGAEAEMEADYGGGGLRLPEYVRLPNLADLTEADAKRRGISARTFWRWKKALREGKPTPRGHGASKELTTLARAAELSSHLGVDPYGGPGGCALPEVMNGVCPETEGPSVGGAEVDQPLYLPGTEVPTALPSPYVHPEVETTATIALEPAGQTASLNVSGRGNVPSPGPIARDSIEPTSQDQRKLLEEGPHRIGCETEGEPLPHYADTS